MPENTLYYGDNLDVLRRYVADESVDLIYLDPPFNSNANYNVLFGERDGVQSAAQIQAFEDTWQWDRAAAAAYEEVVETGPERVSQAMQAFRIMVGEADMLAYLSMMAPRLVELRRVLKPTGSIYLHCDPTASHYLKVLMDAIFGPGQFMNEVAWQRTGAHSSARRYGPVHDVILYYSRSSSYTWNPQFTPHSEDYVASHYTRVDPDGRRWMPDNLTAAGVRSGSSGKPWRGFDVTVKGNHWKFTIENLERLDERGLIYWPERGGWPRYKRYLDTVQGVALRDIWTDIPPVNAKAAERLGYPTQKPVALLERIVRASSNEGDVVLDPFCGCGTAIAAAQKHGRRWIGIDITHLAITLIKQRLRDEFGPEITASYQVIGEPVDVAGARALAAEDPYQFQFWALGLVGARPADQKKGADRGIDGRIYFHDEAGSKTKQIILQVKSGHVHVSQVRDLRGVLEREKAAIGALITLEEPTRPMRSEAASAGFYHSPGWNEDYPRLQVLTVGELLGGQGISAPPTNVTFKQAARVKGEAGQGRLL